MTADIIGHRLPPNCTFEVSDAEDAWAFTHTFDYIHGRALASCFNSPADVIKQAFTFTKPGGYFELQDALLPYASIDDTLHSTTLWKWQDMVISTAKKFGRDFSLSKNYKRYMAEAGYVDVVEHHFQWPINQWPKGKKNKTLGAWYQQDMMEAMQGVSIKLLIAAGMSKEEVGALLDEVKKDFKNTGIHAFMPV